MGAARTMILLVALVAAIGLAVVVRNMMASSNAPTATAEAAPAAPAIPMTRVLVAQGDLGIGTRLTEEHLGWQSFPAEGLNPNYITDGHTPAPPADTIKEKVAEGAGAVVQNMQGGSSALNSLLGAIVREEIVAGEPIQARKLVRGGEGGYLAVVLEPGKRAMGVPVTVESAAGGLILPGDRVDVIQSYETTATGSDGSVRVTHPILLNVRVLAIDQKTRAEDDANSIVGAVATVEVSADAAQALTEAIARGPMQLALRSFSDVNAPSGVAGDGARGSVASKTVRVFSQGATQDVMVAR